MKLIDDYELVVGLEVHVELKTETKIFCACSTRFGARPNTQCCPVCMGLPGAMPTLNEKTVEYAVRAGLALDCRINRVSHFDRKNYFYPDLPKGYQISQYDEPLCEQGGLEIAAESGEKRIRITRIHMEEDAGKLIHEGNDTLIDCNRCGVPLIEIVTEPDIRSPEEAVAFLKKLRSILVYAGVSDCRMNEGSMRCDVNLSVRKLGESTLGTRTEIKNLNSFAFTAKAIESEYARQTEVLENGGIIEQETMRFDTQTGKTSAMRSKENANDYRFFPEPDIPPLVIDDGYIELIRRALPELPNEKKKRYQKDFGLHNDIASVLVSDRALAEYFEAAAKLTEHKKILSNLIATELLRLVDAQRNDTFTSPISSENMAKLASLVGDETINSSTAKKLLSEMFDKDIDPCDAVRERGLAQINDREALLPLVCQALTENPRAKKDYAAGKKFAAKAIVGRVMALTSGRANPSLLSNIVEEEIKK
ncbi:MAG: Asp-tRNA(Asn)/Glu-tRNA(Gln) amidotransferase subunit GatB [Ruminococcaceae bacterium]|nr:Asp-tRNA(Asn)/Glu-tRNA(Gln) amidotransferase subunit GatB [Oscillospiraceae bacterium]